MDKNCKCEETNQLVRALIESHATILAELGIVKDKITPAIDALSNGPMKMFFRRDES